MDSGNSGSSQSSSGGDVELDSSSRGESISPFFNPSPNFGSISTPHPQFLTHQNPTFFDPQHTHSIDHVFPQTTSHNDSNDLIWSGGLRSQHNYANLANLTASSSSSSQQGPSPAVPMLADSQTHVPRASLASDHGLSAVIKTPKKRTRASRRAPTTVLTTDTTNFRQMVQEFTGIPSSPFSAASPYSRRLDLLSGTAALRLGGHLDTLGPLYSLRPTAHKVLSPFSSASPRPSLLNSTMIDSVVPTTNIVSANTISAAAATNSLGASTSNNLNNFPLPSDHLLSLQHHGIPLQLRGNPPMNIGDMSGFPSHETPAAAATVQARDNDNLSIWKSGETVRNNDGLEENLVTGFDGSIDGRSSRPHNIGGYNLNLSQKGMENAVSSGAEGNVASWMCPSD